MAELTVTPVTKAGIAAAIAGLVAAEAGGDEVESAPGLLIVMENGDASSHTLTVTAPEATVDCGEYGDLAVDDLTLVVAAGGVGFLTIPRGYVTSANKFAWTYDAVTSVTVGVFSLAP